MDKDIDAAIIELTAVALKTGVRTDVLADKLIKFGTSLCVAEVGTDETASRLEVAAKLARERSIRPGLKPLGVLPPLDYDDRQRTDRIS